MVGISSMRTPYEQAENAGKQILAKAKKDHLKRKEYGRKETYQAAKEAATYLAHLNTGRVSVTVACDNYEKIFGHS